VVVWPPVLSHVRVMCIYASVYCVCQCVLVLCGCVLYVSVCAWLSVASHW
jgi:hypothetical protein